MNLDKDEDEYVKQKALEHARAMGCNCLPDISYATDDKPGGKAINLTIAHDDDCALVKERGSA